MVRVKFFARLRDNYGDDQSIVYVPGLKVQDAWKQTTSLDHFEENILVAINQQYADKNAVLNDDDELAFFPPVTGG